MSEQKYYVADLLTGDAAWLGKDIFGVISGGHMKPTAFTKTELAELWDGALYKVKQKPRNITINQMIDDGWNKVNGMRGQWEWINPLIELVPDLIYCYSDFKNQWKIEHVPFDSWVSVVTEKEKDAFIRRNKLMEVTK